MCRAISPINGLRLLAPACHLNARKKGHRKRRMAHLHQRRPKRNARPTEQEPHAPPLV